MKDKMIKRKILILSITALFLATGLIGGTLAWLVTDTDTLVNRFEPSEVTSTVEEKMDGNVKSDVKIKNTGDTDAYIRVVLVPSWRDKDDNIALPVAEEDYEIVFNSDDTWFFQDGFWYYKYKVSSGLSTSALIESCRPLVSKEGFGEEPLHFQLQVIASAIQADPEDAVKESWHIDVENGNLVKGGQS